jgi:hypothetical protein
VIFLALRYIRPHWLRRSHHRSSDVDEERDSVFSWSHLVKQLQLALLRLLALFRQRWRRNKAVPDTAPRFGPGADWRDPSRDIRAAYRRVLVAARQAESPRAAAETVREFEWRLSLAFDASTGDDSSGPLHALTSLYQRVRYGDVRLSHDELESGQASADVVIAQLEGLSSPDPSQDP